MIFVFAIKYPVCGRHLCYWDLLHEHLMAAWRTENACRAGGNDAIMVEENL